MIINKRRRQEFKTDYKAREIMLKSKMPRIVFRKTNRYIIGQFIKSKEARDFIIIGLSSKNLIKYGWPKEMAGSLKSLPAAYLTGLLLGEKIIDKDENKAIFDIGLIRNVKKSRAYAFLKGIIDAGININCKKEIFPEEERIKNKKIKEVFEKIKEKIENEFR